MRQKAILVTIMLMLLCIYNINCSAKESSSEDGGDYNKIYSYDEGQGFCARATRGNKWYLINKRGEEIYGPVDNIYPLDTISGRALVSNGDKVSIILWTEEPVKELLSVDITGNYTVEEIQDNLQYNVVMVRNNDTDKVLIYNIDGVGDKEYDEISKFYTYVIFAENGNTEQVYTFAIGTNDGKKGLLTYRNGKIIEQSEIVYQDVNFISERIIFFAGDNETTSMLCKICVDDNGDVVLDNLFEDIIHWKK